MRIGRTLEKLEELYSGWNIPAKKWFLTMGWALRLQGYDSKKETNLLDIGIPISAWPWGLKEEYQDVSAVFIIPPKDSKELNEYENFMKDTEYGLSTHVVMDHVFLGIEKKRYKLRNGKTIQLESVPSMIRTNDFVIELKKELKDYDDIINHLGYIQEISDIARKKEDINIIKICKEILPKYSKSCIKPYQKTIK